MGFCAKYYDSVGLTGNVWSSLQKIDRLTASLHSIDNQPANKHVFFAEDRYAFLSYHSLTSMDSFFKMLICFI